MKLRLATAAAVLLACLLLNAGGALADSDQTSVMQDDSQLIDSGSTAMFTALARMESLGVQTVRVNLEWNTVAPDPDATSLPAGMSPTDPDIYLTDNDAVWAGYDRLANFARFYGISVEFNLTGPGPLWAMGANSPTVRASTHWEPDATDFYAFAYAAGERYSGSYENIFPVSTWSIWNEPNQPGWLSPQWLKVGRKSVAQSPRYYRALVNDGYYGLAFSGHTINNNTILIGETAPEGQDSGGFYTAMTPLPFLRDLYCVNARDKPLRGAGATALGCPTTGPVKDFVDANAGLFDATGYAHHPYDFKKTPTAGQADPNDVPLANLGRLERFLNGTFHTYGVHRTIPIYFTEYGYETNPPDPHQVVSPAQQAAYLNESDYMAWRNPRVKSVAQFLLYDSAPNPDYSPSQYDYWDTFQTGLLFTNGTAKPAYAAYRMPIWLPSTHVKPGTRVLVWGQVRPADALTTQPVTIQWKPGTGAWRTLASADTGSDTGYFTTHVRLPGSGYVRTVWTGTPPGATAPVTDISRRVPVIVKR
jgi:hypothetical protein